jgi:hypothetical protein
MENQNKLNYATLHFAIDDLELIDEALTALKLSRISLGSYKKDDINRLQWQLSQAINPELYTGQDSQLMNS